MTFDEYLRAVIEDRQVGGRTWGQSYWLVLKEVRPDLFEKFGATNLYIAEDERRLGDFLFYVFTKWDSAGVDTGKPERVE